jgi:hypothetical protein
MQSNPFRDVIFIVKQYQKERQNPFRDDIYIHLKAPITNLPRRDQISSNKSNSKNSNTKELVV